MIDARLAVILCLLSTTGSSRVQDILKDTFHRKAIPPNINPQTTADPETTTPKNDDYESLINVNWDTFIAVLIKTAREQLENVKKNIKMNYRLKPIDTIQVDEVFRSSAEDYEQMLQHNLKRLVENKAFNMSLDFMVDFLDLSNFLVEQVIEFNLGRVGGKLLLPTKWYKQVMRQKILRQQAKIATNYVAAHICATLSVCKDRSHYTEYLVEWLRHFLHLSAFSLKNLFIVLPDLLEKHVMTLKTSIKFKKTVKFIVNNDDIVQRDTVDYIDEVITDRMNVANLVPESLKKGAVLLIELFQIIDSNYELSDENDEQLENISKMVKDLVNGDNIRAQNIFEGILKNFVVNLHIWPLEVQNKIDSLWSQIILL